MWEESCKEGRIMHGHAYSSVTQILRYSFLARSLSPVSAASFHLTPLPRFLPFLLFALPLNLPSHFSPRRRPDVRETCRCNRPAMSLFSRCYVPRNLLTNGDKEGFQDLISHGNNFSDHHRRATMLMYEKHQFLVYLLNTRGCHNRDEFRMWVSLCTCIHTDLSSSNASLIFISTQRWNKTFKADFGPFRIFVKLLSLFPCSSRFIWNFVSS